jgi:energy-converting hydrogenase Eha subunit A
VKYWSINYLQGKAMLEAALKNSNLSDAEKRTVQQQAQTKGIGAALGTLAGLVQAAQERYRTMRERMNRLEDSIKSHYQKPFNQTPASAVIIPPLTSEQYVALSNWNAAAQVVAGGFITGITAATGFIIGIKFGPPGALIGAVVGAMAGAMWGTYEVSCLTAVQEQFEQAYNRKESVEVWREGRWSFAVHGAGSSYYAVANGPLSATYVAATTFLMTGKIP